MNKIIDIENLSFGYNKSLILEDINFIVEEGDFWGIIGPNGAGKTTLIKIILGLLRPLKGRVEVLGKAPWRLKDEKKKIGYIAQRSEIERYFPIKVWDLVVLGRKILNNWKRIDERDKEIIEQVLENVGMLEYKNKLFSELSGGQQQRVLVAKALAQEPKLILLDEPTVGVDITAQERFYNLLQELNNKGLTIILVSHDIGVISKRVRKLACLNRRIFLHGCPKDIRIHETLRKIYGEEFLLLTHEGEDKE